MLREELMSAAMSKDVERRRNLLSEQQEAEFVRERLEHIEETLKDLRTLLYFRGVRETDVYYTAAKKAAFTKDNTNLSPRVRWDNRYGTPSFSWERLHRKAHMLGTGASVKKACGKGKSYEAWVTRGKSKSKEKMRVVLTSEHVSLRARSQSISPSEFSNEPLWARVVGLETEVKLTELRRKNRVLADIGRLLARLKAMESGRTNPENNCS